MELTEENYTNIISTLEENASNCGLETYPFKIGWYNEALLDKKFELNDDYDTLAFVVISKPAMFEKAFLPFLCQEATTGTDSEIKDPLDRCMKETFNHLSQLFSNEGYTINAMHDFEISPVTKRPKVLVQTAGHVSGAVRFYQKHDLNGKIEIEAEYSESELNFINNVKSSKIFPVCLHPRYGGWFALRGVLVFRNVKVPGNLGLKRTDPPKILRTKFDIANLLYLFNEHWRDSRYRDVGMSTDLERYSDLQRKYFGTEPSERSSLIQQIINHQQNRIVLQQ